jgi:ribosome-associated protein
MDYVDFIVHVFSREKRAFYGLERLRKSATTISVAALNAELKAKIISARAHKAATAKKAVAKKAVVKKSAVKKSAAPAVKVAKKATKSRK